MSLTSARYGKDLVRVLRVVRHTEEHVAGGAGVAIPGPVHDVAEYNVRVFVEGDIDDSYTKADNGVVVATDSMKNIIYYLAKCSPHILTPELFATHIGAFILGKYAHLKRAHVDIERLKWSRIVSGDVGNDSKGANAGHGHKHSFIRDGDEKHIVHVEVSKLDNRALDVKLTAGIVDLLVLKSSGSSFENFIRDEFTTLPEAADRILSTAVNMKYDFPIWKLGENELVQGGSDILADVKQMRNTGVVAGAGDIVGLIGDMGTTLDVWGAMKKAREETLRVFCKESASVQATIYDMGRALLDAHGSVERVSYSLPNKHYIGVDLGYVGLANDGEVFMPIAAPSGIITATVSRHGDPAASE